MCNKERIQLNLFIGCGVLTIIELSNLKADMKYDFVQVKDGLLIHRQVERKNGFIYMRMKRRPAIVIKGKGC